MNDAKGDMWEITATYDDRAEIPEGAEVEISYDVGLMTLGDCVPVSIVA